MFDRRRSLLLLATTTLACSWIVGCKSDEAEVEETPSAQSTGSVGASANATDSPAIAPVESTEFGPVDGLPLPGERTIEGQWRKGLSLQSFHPPRRSCEELTFQLTSLDGRLRSPDREGTAQTLALNFQLNGRGIKGAVTSPGPPWFGCIEPNLVTFTAELVRDDLLGVNWSCTAPDGTLLNSKGLDYNRGTCEGVLNDGPQETLSKREDGVTLNGDNLTYYQSPDPDLCQTDCRRNPQCAGWTFIKKGGYAPGDPSMCYLAKRVTGYVYSPCCTSGLERPIEPLTPEEEAATRTPAPTPTPTPDDLGLGIASNVCAGYNADTDDSAFVFSNPVAECQSCAESCARCAHVRVCGCAVRDYETDHTTNACVECMDKCLEKPES